MVTTTKIIIYRGFNIETTTFGDKLTSIEVIGNYTGRFDDAKRDGIPRRADKLTADILRMDKKENPLQIRVHLQDKKWIQMGITEKYFSSIDECIDWMKKCIDRYLFRE